MSEEVVTRTGVPPSVSRPTLTTLGIPGGGTSQNVSTLKSSDRSELVCDPLGSSPQEFLLPSDGLSVVETLGPKRPSSQVCVWSRERKKILTSGRDPRLVSPVISGPIAPGQSKSVWTRPVSVRPSSCNFGISFVKDYKLI